tara:strand:- start:5278 stop:5751 length:474 start_codon:yes stop_codon:yes gene_type:complete
MDIVQQQNCDLTMHEGLEIYYDSFPASRSPLKDNCDSGNLLRNHDCTHVIFGLDTSIEQEALLDIWVLFGCNFRLASLIAYTKLPQLKGLYRDLYKDYGVRGMVDIYRKNFHSMRKVFSHARKMKKKWPLECPEKYLSRSIDDLRREYGINILHSKT